MFLNKNKNMMNNMNGYIPHIPAGHFPYPYGPQHQISNLIQIVEELNIRVQQLEIKIQQQENCLYAKIPNFIIET